MATATAHRPPAQSAVPWIIREDVPVFEAHEGVDEEVLHRIADRMNLRAEETGEGCPLIVGHTVDGKPEWEQPPIVGYCDRYKVKAGRRGIPTLYHREKLYPSCDVGGEMMTAEKIRRRFPRRSVEYLPHDDLLDPISMLGATTPRQELALAYSNDGSRIRYAMPGFADAGAPPQEELTGAEPPMPAPPAPGAQPAALDGITIINAFREFLSQLEAMSGRGVDVAPSAPPPAPAPEAAAMPPEPAAVPAPEMEKEIPEAPAEENEEKEHFNMGAAAVGGANAGYIPGMAGEERQRMANDQDRIRFSKLESEVAQLRKDNERLMQESAVSRRRYSRAECEKQLIQCEAEGVQLDRAEELEMMAPLDPKKPGMSDEQIAGHMKRVRERYQRIPTGQLIRTEGDVSTGGGGKRKAGATQAQIEKASKLAAKHPNGYAGALADVMASSA
jgi:hypothetical protein